MDYIDFVVHVFHEEKREFYRLERLWGDAPRHELDLPEDDLPGTRRPSGDDFDDDFDDDYDDDAADGSAAG